MTAPQYPQTFGMPVPTKQKGSGLGIAALVLGIVSLALCWVPVVNILFIICGIVGVVLGIIGIFVSHRVMSIVGAGLGLLGIILAIVVNNAFTNEVNNAVNGSTPTVQQPADNNAAPAAPQPADNGSGDDAKQPVAKIGQTVHSGDFDFTVTNVSHAKSVGGQFGKTAQGEYVVLDVTIKNTGDDTVTFDDGSQKLVDSAGKRYSADSAADFYANQNNTGVLFNDINPGNAVNGKLLFDMPNTATPDKALLSGGMFTDASPATISLR